MSRRRSPARIRTPEIKKADVPRVIGYLRVSSKKQDKSGLSLEAQEERIKKYVEYQGYELHSICVDRALSGRTLKRAAFQKVLRILQSGQANTLCVTKPGPGSAEPERGDHADGAILQPAQRKLLEAGLLL